MGALNRRDLISSEWHEYLEGTTEQVRLGMQENKSDAKVIADIMQSDTKYKKWQRYSSWRARNLRVILNELKRTE